MAAAPSVELSSLLSWGDQADQDVVLPDVCENVAADAHQAPAVSYASCARKNLLEEGSLDLRAEEKDLYQQYLSSSKFEDNFHPYHTPPERPCSAFFNFPEHFTTTKDIFDALLRDGFPAMICSVSRTMVF